MQRPAPNWMCCCQRNWIRRLRGVVVALISAKDKGHSRNIKSSINFLPGQAHPFADQRISFAGIAQELNLGHFWISGSKLPAITSLLEKTFEIRRDLFCSLILEVMRRGIKYRDVKGNPIAREEINNYEITQ